MRKLVKSATLSASSAVLLALSAGPVASAATAASEPTTTTPIQHVVVIFDENISFDHYFGTYPNATNPDGEAPFYPAPNTPSVNGLTGSLLTNNPNGTNPQRLDPSQPITQSNDHGYTAEQTAADNGKMDNFIKGTGRGNSVVLNYYDGNTVTGIWNYAQHYALNDNSFGTNYGPSSVGAVNLISGQTAGATVYADNVTKSQTVLKPGDTNFPTSSVSANGTLVGDQDPYYDNFSKGPTVAMSGKNVGDLLNAKNVTWGWFEGGFANTSTKSNNVGGSASTDYSAHHEPFQYYKSTANPNHLPPTSTAMIGKADQANHQYDITDFWKAADAGNMPAVSFLKAPEYEDGHASYSDPTDEQKWIVDTINHIQSLPDWQNTAIIVSYDDSDGWYDHVLGPLVNGSNDPNYDTLAGKGDAGKPVLGTYEDRAGYGPRLPLLVISPYAKRNYVDNTLTDQTSILRFIEDNWDLGRIGDGSFDAIAGSLNNMFDFTDGPQNGKLMLDSSTGEPVSPDVAPYSANGFTYMSMSNLAQNLDVSFSQDKHDVWFDYNGSHVVIPMHGNHATVDGQSVELGAPLQTVKGALTVPIDNLAVVLGVKVVNYKNSVLFDAGN
ncbi:alkaline phosphatase family protein [Alicyclobacillus dauci]|uniref:Stalk domain-containing protein n=1 Tax=Alicyclobacillus dauci TaxID=1475485 RepID=A0ABY6ZA35_9BACL|nr:alkaline phosphatase family protein [Alicyclobacillus dauci]WAH38960.1 stalk domain-containing protein [Alicyclobacillus dauci]